MKEFSNNKKSTFDKINTDNTKLREGHSVTKKDLISYSKKKPELKSNHLINKSKNKFTNNNINSGNHTGGRSGEIKFMNNNNNINDKNNMYELKKIKSLEEKLTNYNEKETFDNLIKYAKKGDRVNFMDTIET
jgi:hypothetical protein